MVKISQWDMHDDYLISIYIKIRPRQCFPHFVNVHRVRISSRISYYFL